MRGLSAVTEALLGMSLMLLGVVGGFLLNDWGFFQACVGASYFLGFFRQDKPPRYREMHLLGAISFGGLALHNWGLVGGGIGLLCLAVSLYVVCWFFKELVPNS